MRQKRWGWMLVGLVILGILGTVAAQPATWSAWLYDYEAGRVTRVDSTGATLDDFVLPTVMGHTRYSNSVSVSHNGQYIAYTVYNPDMRVMQLLVYDTAAGEWAATYSPGMVFADSVDFASGPHMYNAFDTALAYSYNIFDEGWQIVVIDLLTGATMFNLSSTDPSVVALGIDSFLTPVVQQYEGAEVHFTMIAAGSEGAVINQNFTWNVLTNNVTSSVRFPSLFVDIFEPTGEMVMATFDERLPNQIEELPLPRQVNALHVYDPTLNARFPFFASDAMDLLRPRFIESGRRVITGAYDFNISTQLWIVLERDGTVVGYAPIEVSEFDSIRGISEGFIYTTQTSSGGDDQLILMQVDTRTGLSSGFPVWVAPAGSLPRLVWAGDPDDTALDYGPWGVLAEPVTEAEALISPADVPTATPLVSNRVLRVGGSAIVNTTEGDNLNVRSGPGTGFQIVARVENGTRVTLLEGPRSAEGFVWWRMRLPDGKEGWAVESADGIATLIPSG